MKRTIEYCDELVNDKSRTYYKIVQQIQIDAIDAVIEACESNFIQGIRKLPLEIIAKELKKELE